MLIINAPVVRYYASLQTQISSKVITTFINYLTYMNYLCDSYQSFYLYLYFMSILLQLLTYLLFLLADYNLARNQIWVLI